VSALAFLEHEKKDETNGGTILARVKFVLGVNPPP